MEHIWDFIVKLVFGTILGNGSVKTWNSLRANKIHFYAGVQIPLHFQDLSMASLLVGAIRHLFFFLSINRRKWCHITKHWSGVAFTTDDFGTSEVWLPLQILFSVASTHKCMGGTGVEEDGKLRRQEPLKLALNTNYIHFPKHWSWPQNSSLSIL